MIWQPCFVYKMAASISQQEKRTAESTRTSTMSLDFIDEISEQFFEMVPVRKMKWTDEEADMLISSLELQQNLLKATVRHPLCMEFPPSISYRKHFMKLLINKLESEGAEICDEMYEAYAELLSLGEDEEDNICFKSYRMPYGKTMSLKESTNLVSNGTTGLSTWQAAQNLSEWLIEHSHILADKSVIELGSGQGLTGLIACQLCSVKNYTFSDCHPQVLQLLSRNIESNLSHTEQARSVPLENMEQTHKTMDSVNPMRDCCVGKEVKETFEGGDDEIHLDYVELDLNSSFWTMDSSRRIATFKPDHRVSICSLDWECLKERFLEKLRSNVILGADVVYDSRITPALVYVLRRLLEKGPSSSKSKPEAYIASTVRNEDTRDDFFVSLGSQGLSYAIVDPPTKQLFHYDRSVPIEIVKISLE